MQVVGITPFTGAAANRAEPRAAHTVECAAPGTVPGTALVPVAAPAPHRTIHPSGRPDAAFIAHLIATADHAPQTRLLRRAAPADAVTRYRVASDTPPINTATGVSRTA